MKRVLLVGILWIGAGAGCAYMAGGAYILTQGGDDGGGKGQRNTPPLISVVTPPGAPNDLISIHYQAIDLQWDPIDIIVEYAISGQPFQTATQAEGAGSSGVTGLETTAVGVAYTFVWNSRIDLGSVNQVDVRIRITPLETFGTAWGDPAETLPFTVYNAYVATVAGGGLGSGLNFPSGIAIDPGTPGDTSDDVIYVADTFHNRVLRHHVGTALTEVHAGTGEPGFQGDHIPATEATLNLPIDVAIDASGDILICDLGNYRVHVVDSGTRFIRTLVGGGSLVPPDIGDGLLSEDCVLYFPSGIDLDAAGNLYIADTANHRVRVVNRTPTAILVAGVVVLPSTIQTIAGDGSPVSGPGPVGDGGPSVLAEVGLPTDVAVSLQGPIFITQTEANRIRVVNPTAASITVAGIPIAPGTIETLAGTGTPGFSGDGGPPDVAEIHGVNGIALDSVGNVYLADGNNFRIRAINLGAGPLVVGGATVDPGTINTIAGTSALSLEGDGNPALEATIFFPSRVALDTGDNVILAEGGSNRVRVINTQATTTSWGGIPVQPGHVNTLPVALAEESIRFQTTARIVVDDDGHFYFTEVTDNAFGETGGNRIYRMDGETAEVTIIAGIGVGGFAGDGGPPEAAVINFPADLALDGQGNIFFTDTFNHRLRAINRSEIALSVGSVDVAPGTIETIGGIGNGGYGGDGGRPTQAYLRAPISIDLDGDGNIIFAEQGNSVVRFINRQSLSLDVAGTLVGSGDIETIVGDGTAAYSGDGGPAGAAQLSTPGSVALDDRGNIYIADAGNYRIRAVNTQVWVDNLLGVDIAPGDIDTVVGTGIPGSGGDGGPATSADLTEVRDIQIDHYGNLWLVDSFNHRIRLVNGETSPIWRGGVSIDPGFIDAVIGEGQPGFNGDGGGNLETTINQPSGLGVYAGESVVFTDTGNATIRLANLSGIESRIGPHLIDPLTVRTIAGDPSTRGNRLVVAPEGLVRDVDGAIFFTDTVSGNNHSHRLFRLDPLTRAMAVLGGAGFPGWSGDGQPVGTAELNTPRAVALDAAENLYVADTENHIVRVVNLSQATATVAGISGIEPGSIVTIAGFPRMPGHNGNDRAALGALLRAPSGVALSPTGRVFIADTGNHQIRVVDTAGTITLLAGNDPVGPGTLAGEFNGPTGLYLDGTGNLIVADTGNHRIQGVDSTSGGAMVVVGNATGTGGFNGDGLPPGDILLSYPRGVASDVDGHLFIVDTDSHRLLVYNPHPTDVVIAGTLVESGLVRTIAGIGESGFNGDALPPSSTALSFPAAVLLDPTSGDIYIADTGNRRIRRFAR